ncbi:hypothetical protein [Burkholderia sp. LMG 21824]|uniref:IS66 family transposase n=1 Tax=Burkholderia sp. LMG 21824 TaxID=3158172 RepID=UPI003C2DE687
MCVGAAGAGAYISIIVDELTALLAIREAYESLQCEHKEIRGALRPVTAERDLAEERLRAYRRELFGAKGEARDSDRPGLFNEAEAIVSPPTATLPGCSSVCRRRKPLTATTRRYPGRGLPICIDVS